MSRITVSENRGVSYHTRHYDFLFKVILIGEGEATKSGLLYTLTGQNNILPDYKKTIGVNFGITSIYLNNYTIKLQIWDISYENRLKYLRHLYFKGASGCIVVVRTLNEAQAHLEELKSYYYQTIPILFIVISDESLDLQQSKVISQQKVKIINSGYEGVEWLAQSMLLRQRNKKNKIDRIGVLTISNNEIETVITNLRETQMRIEREQLRRRREQRLKQLTSLKKVLNDMNIPVDQDFVKILTSEALFEINLLNGTVSVFPLKCNQCQTICEKKNRAPKRLCIIEASRGWSSELDAESLLILSKIYALLHNKLPKHVQKQIKKIIQCPNYRPRKNSSKN